MINFWGITMSDVVTVSVFLLPRKARNFTKKIMSLPFVFALDRLVLFPRLIVLT